MPFIPPETIQRARQVDLLTYLETCEPNELVHISGNHYCTREHDSLKISNGNPDDFHSYCYFCIFQFPGRVGFFLRYGYPRQAMGISPYYKRLYLSACNHGGRRGIVLRCPLQ